MKRKALKVLICRKCNWRGRGGSRYSRHEIASRAFRHRMSRRRRCDNPEEDRFGAVRNTSAEGANTNSIAAAGVEGGAGDESQRA